jgi:sterol desaturase/sphingolipid hydroxylase (fatty acid hydroxylase superfamily)
MKDLVVGDDWRVSGVTLLLGCFFLVALWELFWPRRALESAVAPRWLGNLVVYFINGALFAWLSPALSYAAARIEPSLGLGLVPWPQSLSVANFAIGFLFLDFSRYWLHRLFHSVPWLWRLHSLHHADSDVDVSTSFRHHPVEFVVGSGLFWLAFLIMGFPADIAAAYLLCTSILSCIQHGNVALPASWDPVLQRAVVTPDMHRLHHSVVPDEANSNFGFLFSFWDRVFATDRRAPRTAHDSIQFGLRDFRNPSFQQMLLLPLLVRSTLALRVVPNSPKPDFRPLTRN